VRRPATWRAAALAVLVALCEQLVLPARADQPAPDQIRLAINTEAYNNLPLFVAMDNGYFQQQHLNVVVVPYTGSSLTQLPFLARGEIDLTGIAPAPGLFNLGTEGFNVKVVASFGGAHSGWNGTSWMMVRQDLWDTKKIVKPADLRGMHVDVAVAGSPNDVLARETIRLAKLTPADLTLTDNVRTPPSWFAALRNRAVDVQCATEPYATQLEREGLAHKWISYPDSAPWFQDFYLAASPVFARDHHDALRRFLIAYLEAARDITNAGPVWSAKEAAEVSKWSQVPVATIMQIPGPGYPGQLGLVNLSSLERVQTYWVTLGLVKTPEPLANILDLTALGEARKALHIR
jgi:ABC-type nitrate/sulfonate/bicarbonate transport system substrate-binding protein